MRFSLSPATRFAWAIAATASVTACTAGSGISPSAAGSVPQAVYAAAACPSAVVAITANYTETIELYDPSNLSAGPCGHIGGFHSARGLLYDSKGDLWVTDSIARQIYEFAPGAKTPTQTLNDPSGIPIDVTVDEAGKNVYVIDYQNEDDATALVEVYENGSPTPSRTLGDSAARNGAFGAVDNQGNLYVTFMTQSNLAQVDRFAGGTGTPENLGLKLVSAGAIVTTKTGALAVCDPFAYRCGIFERGEQKMSHVFGHMGRGGNDAVPNKPPILHPDALALDRLERRAYVSADTLSQWAYPGPVRSPNHLPLVEIKVPHGGGEGIAVFPPSRPGAPY